MLVKPLFPTHYVHLCTVTDTVPVAADLRSELVQLGAC